MASDYTFRPKRTNLDLETRIGVAERLQFLVLDEIAKCHGRNRGLIFHGGTSISLLHGSPRWSEDIDFMATPQVVSGVFGRRKMIERMLSMRMSLELPASSVSLRIKGSGQEEGHGQVERMMLRWEHPSRIGAVRVKVEFYTCPKDSLAAYAATLMRPHRGNVEGRLIHGAEPAAIRADKIVAIAQRPVIKHRDIHDLGFISPMVPEGDDIEKALMASMGIYNKSPEDILEGLQREVLSGMDSDRDGFIDNMQRWFEPDIFESMRREGRFDQLFDSFRSELRLGRDALERMTQDCGPCW